MFVAPFLLCLAPFDPPSPAQVPPASWQAVLDGYHRALEKGGIVGSSLTVVRDGRVIARDRHGRRAVSCKRSVPPRSRFRSACPADSVEA